MHDQSCCRRTSGAFASFYPEHAPWKLTIAVWIGCLAMIGTTQATTAAEATDGSSFVDEFDRFDPVLWFASDGWSNGHHQNCTWSSRQVDLSGGMLKLGFDKTPYKDRNYSCAEIQSKLRYGFGVYEARMRTSGSQSGLNAAFFTYIGPMYKQPHDEIDFEILLKDASKVQLNTYVGGQSNNWAYVDVSGGSHTAFHDYAFVWEPRRLRWFIDGKLMHESSAGSDIPSHPQKIFFSLWGSDTLTDWMGPFLDPGQPLTLEIDRAAYTALGDKCQFPESIVCALP